MSAVQPFKIKDKHKIKRNRKKDERNLNKNLASRFARNVGEKAKSATTTPQPKSIIYEEGPYFGVNSASKNQDDFSQSFNTSGEQQ